MNKKIRKTSIILFFVLSIILVLTVGQNRKINLSVNQSTTPQASNTNSLQLPFPINKPYLGMVILVYNFSGGIKEIKTTSDGSQLILDISDNNLPPFILNPGYTKLYKAVDGQPKEISANDLKMGQNVSVQIMYDLKLNVWRVIRVDTF